MYSIPLGIYVSARVWVFVCAYNISPDFNKKKKSFQFILLKRSFFFYIKVVHMFICLCMCICWYIECLYLFISRKHIFLTSVLSSQQCGHVAFHSQYGKYTGSFLKVFFFLHFHSFHIFLFSISYPYVFFLTKFTKNHSNKNYKSKNNDDDDTH